MDKSELPDRERGVVALTIPLLLLLAIAAVLFILISQGLIKIPSKALPTLPGQKKEPTVELQKQYQNPFDKSSQYLNPFSGYKNPFDALKQSK